MTIKEIIRFSGQRIGKGGAYLFGAEAVNLIQKVVSKTSKFCVKTTTNFFENKIEHTKKETYVINQKLDGWGNYCIDETNANLKQSQVRHNVDRSVATVVQAAKIESDATIELATIKLNEARILKAIRQAAIDEGLDLEIYTTASAPGMLPTQQMIANTQSEVKPIKGAEPMSKPEYSSALRCHAGTYKCTTSREKLLAEDAILSSEVQG